MKKLFILIMALLIYAVPAFAEGEKNDYRYISGSENDIAATGEYVGFRKITNHKLIGEYEIYFKASYNNGITSQQIETVCISNHDMNEVFTFNLDGQPFTATRGYWYEALRRVDPNGDKGTVLSKLVTQQFYNEFFAYEYGQHRAGKIAEEYIEKIYFVREVPGYEPPQPRTSLMDIKIVEPQPKKKKWWEKIL